MDVQRAIAWLLTLLALIVFVVAMAGARLANVSPLYLGLALLAAAWLLDGPPPRRRG